MSSLYHSWLWLEGESEREIESLEKKHLLNGIFIAGERLRNGVRERAKLRDVDVLAPNRRVLLTEEVTSSEGGSQEWSENSSVL